MDLIKRVESYRVASEDAAIQTIQDFREKQAEGGYTLTKSSYVLKVKRMKGEIVDSYYIVTVELNYEE